MQEISTIESVFAEPPPAASPVPPVQAGPVALQERIETIDILRGFAFFGVLLVNYMFFYQPESLSLTGFRWQGPANQITEKTAQFFFMGKFYTIFSFLFGLGFSLQLVRAEARGASIVPTYRKRLFALLLFGVIHGTLIWFGDILTTYALFGFLLLLFRKRKQKTLLIWVLVLLCVNMLLPVVRYAVYEYRRSDPKTAAKMAGERELRKRRAQEESDDARKTHAEGTYGEILEMRTAGYIRTQAISLAFGGQFLLLFLLGLYAGRRGIFQNVADNEPLLRRIRNWGLIVGIIGNAMFVYALRVSNPMVPDLISTLGFMSYMFGIPALSFFYVSALTLLIHHRQSWRKRLAPLGYVGRMALTNYLLHSIVGTLLFYGYGLGLFMKFGPAVTALICLALYSLQMVFSKWWLSRFQYGPAEWFWRALTYGKQPPFRINVDRGVIVAQSIS